MCVILVLVWKQFCNVSGVNMNFHRNISKSYNTLQFSAPTFTQQCHIRCGIELVMDTVISKRIMKT